MAFYFLISHRDSRNDKIQKTLLNIPLNSELDFLEIRANHFSLPTYSNLKLTNEECSKLDSKLTIKKILKILNKSISSENCRLHYNWTSKKPNVVIYYDLHPEKHIGFVFEATLLAVEKFVKFCLKKLFEINEKLTELKNLTTIINKNFGFHSPRGNAVKSSELTYRISEFYINHKLEEILILNRSSYSSDNWSESYNHINKEVIVNELMNKNNGNKSLADLRYLGENLGDKIILE